MFDHTEKDQNVRHSVLVKVWGGIYSLILLGSSDGYHLHCEQFSNIY